MAHSDAMLEPVDELLTSMATSWTGVQEERGMQGGGRRGFVSGVAKQMLSEQLATCRCSGFVSCVSSDAFALQTPTKPCFLYGRR